MYVVSENNRIKTMPYICNANCGFDPTLSRNAQLFKITDRSQLAISSTAI